MDRFNPTASLRAELASLVSSIRTDREIESGIRERVRRRQASGDTTLTMASLERLLREEREKREEEHQISTKRRRLLAPVSDLQVQSGFAIAVGTAALAVIGSGYAGWTLALDAGALSAEQLQVSALTVAAVLVAAVMWRVRHRHRTRLRAEIDEVLLLCRLHGLDGPTGAPDQDYSVLWWWEREREPLGAICAAHPLLAPAVAKLATVHLWFSLRGSSADHDRDAEAAARLLRPFVRPDPPADDGWSWDMVPSQGLRGDHQRIR